MASARATPSPIRDAQIIALIERVGAEVIGDRIRRVRTRMGLSIRDVAASSRLSKTSIVRLEQGGRCRASSLIRVCEVLGLHLDGLNGGTTGETTAIHRAGDDRWYDIVDVAGTPLDNGKNGRAAEASREGMAVAVDLLKSRLPEGRVLPTILEVHGESVARSHAGEEFVYVLSGRLRLTVGAKVFELSKGESACFWSGEPHRYARLGPRPTRVLSVRVNG